jgi:hypothetical protein
MLLCLNAFRCIPGGFNVLCGSQYGSGSTVPPPLTCAISLLQALEVLPRLEQVRPSAAA